MAISVPTLTVTDNEDGTATFAVTGSSTGSLNMIQYAKTTDLVWIDIVELLGNSTSSATTMQTGTHWFTCRSRTPTVPNYEQAYSAPQMYCISSNAEAVYKRILDAVVAELQSIATAGSLPGLDATKVARQDAIFISNLPFDLPGIVVAPGAQEEDKGGTNERDDIGYPVQIAIVDSKWSKDPDPDSTDIDYLLIRERIRRHFQNRRLALIRSSVPESYTTKVTYEGILDHETTTKGLMRFGSYLTLNFATREPRGA
jgi:hypothetical protein